MKIFLRIVVGLIVVILLACSLLLLRRPSRTDYQADLFQGVSWQALAGKPLLVRHGISIIRQGQETLHPRTAVGVDKAGKRLWLVVIDGRQDYYSEGVTLAELADIFVGLGAETALKLEGGGSRRPWRLPKEVGQDD